MAQKGEVLSDEYRAKLSKIHLARNQARREASESLKIREREAKFKLQAIKEKEKAAQLRLAELERIEEQRKQLEKENRQKEAAIQSILTEAEETENKVKSLLDKIKAIETLQNNQSEIQLEEPEAKFEEVKANKISKSEEHLLKAEAKAAREKRLAEKKLVEKAEAKAAREKRLLKKGKQEFSSDEEREKWLAESRAQIRLKAEEHMQRIKDNNNSGN